jgi:hypothetical protein
MQTFILLNNVLKSVIFWVITPVVQWNSTDVSREHIASIYRAENQAEQYSNLKAGGKESNRLDYDVWTETSVTWGTLASQMWCVHSGVALVVRLYCDTSASLVGCLLLWSANAIPALVWCRSSAYGCCNFLLLWLGCRVAWSVDLALRMLF